MEGENAIVAIPWTRGRVHVHFRPKQPHSGPQGEVKVISVKSLPPVLLILPRYLYNGIMKTGITPLKRHLHGHYTVQNMCWVAQPCCPIVTLKH